jgi:hypothetical protein
VADAGSWEVADQGQGNVALFMTIAGISAILLVDPSGYNALKRPLQATVDDLTAAEPTHGSCGLTAVLSTTSASWNWAGSRS